MEAEMVKDTIANTVLAALLWALGQYLGVDYAESLVTVWVHPLERYLANRRARRERRVFFVAVLPREAVSGGNT